MKFRPALLRLNEDTVVFGEVRKPVAAGVEEGEDTVAQSLKNAEHKNVEIQRNGIEVDFDDSK